MRTTDLAEIPSPYTEGVFDHLMKANPNENWVALWETNRGCPFRVPIAFGSFYKQKGLPEGYKKELYREIDWFSINKIEFIFAAMLILEFFKGDVSPGRIHRKK